MTTVGAAERGAQVGEHRRLGGRVERRRGVVEQQQRRVGAPARGRGRCVGAARRDRPTPRSPTIGVEPVRQARRRTSASATSQRRSQISSSPSSAPDRDVVADRAGRAGTAPGTRARRRPAARVDRARRRRRPARRSARSSVVLPEPVGADDGDGAPGRDRRGRRRAAPSRSPSWLVARRRRASTPLPALRGSDRRAGRARPVRRAPRGCGSSPAIECGSSRQREADQAQREHEQREQVDEAGQLADASCRRCGPGTRRPTTQQRCWRRWARRRAATRTCCAAGSAPNPRLAQPRGDRRQRSVSRLSAPNALTTVTPVEALVHGRRELAELVLGGVVVAVDTALVDDVERDQHREHRRPRRRRARSR